MCATLASATEAHRSETLANRHHWQCIRRSPELANETYVSACARCTRNGVDLHQHLRRNACGDSDSPQLRVGGQVVLPQTRVSSAIRLAGCSLIRCSTSTRLVLGSIPCSRQVTINLWMMPTCLARHRPHVLRRWRRLYRPSTVVISTRWHGHGYCTSNQAPPLRERIRDR